MEITAQDLIDEQPKKKSIFKKPFVIGIIAIILVAALVAALAIFHTAHVSITISEPMGSGPGGNGTFTEEVSLEGMPGDTIEKNFTIYNSEDYQINIEVSWNETSNDGVEYTTNMPYSRLADPGDNIYNAIWNINSGSPAGELNGTVIFTRL